MCERGESQGQQGGQHRSCNRIHLGATGSFTVSFALLLTLAACSSTIVKRGQQFGDLDVAQVQRGMSQEQVKMALGTPATTASVGTGNAYYYISSTMKETALTTPQEIDRRVVAVYFAQTGTVDRVAHYGLKDGKVFDFISRTTPRSTTGKRACSRRSSATWARSSFWGLKRISGSGHAVEAARSCSRVSSSPPARWLRPARACRAGNHAGDGRAPRSQLNASSSSVRPRAAANSASRSTTACCCP